MLTKNIEKFASLTRQHAEADLLVQGTYYDEDTGKACFIGCFAHGNRPEVIAEEFGIPVMLTRIAERIFEALPKGEDLDFFLAIPGAIGSDGKDLSRVGWAFLADTLRAMPPQDGAVKQAVDDVISGLDRLAAGGEWLTAARAKADAAAAADEAAGDENAAWAAWAAAWAAEAAKAVWAAEAVAWAKAALAAWAAKAAWAASWAAKTAKAENGRQRDAFLRLVSEAPVLGLSGGGSMSAKDINDWPGHPDADPDCECCLGDGLQADGETPCPCIDARKGYCAAQASPDQYRREGAEAIRMAAAPMWKGPGETPHRYSPDYMAQGDCHVCGHHREAHQSAPDAVARLWHAARLGLDMARANDLTNTAETIMEAMNAVECPCKGSDEMCPCQNRRPAPDAVARLKVVARCGTDSTMRHFAYASMAQDPDGDYVTYSDYAALAEENRRLREALEEIADIETPQAQVLLIARAALTSGGRG